MTEDEYNAEIKRLAAKYNQFGVDETLVRNLIKITHDPNFDLEYTLLIAKIALAKEHPEAGDEFVSLREMSRALTIDEELLAELFTSAGIPPVEINFGIQFKEDNA